MDDIQAAVAAAVGSAKGEVNADPTAGVEPDKPAPAAKPEESKPTEKPKSESVQNAAPSADSGQGEKADKGEEDDFWKPSSDEIAAIEADPKLQKVYKSMQRGFTKKRQEDSARLKEFEEKAKVADWVQSNPAAAAKILAEHTGMTLSEAKKEIKDAEDKVLDELESRWEKTVGKEAAALLRPLFQDEVKSLVAQIVAPVQETTEQLAHAAAERGIAASVREFGAGLVEQGLDWDDEIQQEMADLSRRVEPAEDENGKRVPMSDYLETLYNAVVAKRTRSDRSRANLDRLRRIKAEAEPVGGIRPAPANEETVTANMNDNEAIAIAVKAAQRQLGRR